MDAIVSQHHRVPGASCPTLCFITATLTRTAVGSLPSSSRAFSERFIFGHSIVPLWHRFLGMARTYSCHSTCLRLFWSPT